MKNKYPEYVLKHFIIWTLAFAFWNILRRFGHDIVSEYPYPTSIYTLIKIHLILGVIAGFLFGSLEFFYEKRIFKNLSFGQIMILGPISYLITVLLLISFGTRIFTKAMGIELSWELYTDFMFSKEMILLIFYCFVIGFFIDFFQQINKKLGPGNLWKMIKGEFYSPKEEERVFMFLDLKSSTSIAEKIGHMKYSKLIQDCFQDLDVVRKSGAEIYQYVGDEAVLTWKKETGLANGNCLKAFFDFQLVISEKSAYYLKNYDLIPEFKAGVNVGKIVVAEVGQVKTEIAYHGDTINTASRIQDQCNVFDEPILVSQDLKSNINGTFNYTFSHVGGILLKGKSDEIDLYKVSL